MHKFYAGSTNDLANRLYRHNAGHEKFTSKGTPWILVWSCPLDTRAEAYGLEQKIKKRGIRKFLADEGILFSDESRQRMTLRRQGRRFESCLPDLAGQGDFFVTLSFFIFPETVEQHALMSANAEKYYRTMLQGRAHSWNVRCSHMQETLERLLDFHGSGSKAIVWAHNTPIGDAKRHGNG